MSVERNTWDLEREQECPRCSRRTVLPAYSRITTGVSGEIWICAACALDEAARDVAGLPPVAPAEWPVAGGPAERS